ncbi:hypothetical protein ACDA63_18745 [Uliginosibacterium sp. sgz301328]|uniref:hypothetical protein n=1 Tax=Uliginosibacterium sp. sgz301328 TaxID=3243764 RepID=UPI00359EAA00
MAYGEIPVIAVLVLLFVVVGVRNHRTAKKMVLEWLEENDHDHCRIESIQFPPFGDRSEARVILVSSFGQRRLVVLRLTERGFRAFLKKAELQSISSLN